MKAKVGPLGFALLFLAGTVAIHAAEFGDFIYGSDGTAITIPETIAGTHCA